MSLIGPRKGFVATAVWSALPSVSPIRIVNCSAKASDLVYLTSVDVISVLVAAFAATRHLQGKGCGCGSRSKCLLGVKSQDTTTATMIIYDKRV